MVMELHDSHPKRGSGLVTEDMLKKHGVGYLPIKSGLNATEREQGGFDYSGNPNEGLHQFKIFNEKLKDPVFRKDLVSSLQFHF
jgi:hypothetical protein